MKYRLRTNSLGFKDAAARVVTWDSATANVLLIGDSFTEGVGVDFDSTFAGLLAQRAMAGGIQVLNAGLSSYAPVNYWRKVVDIVDRRRVPIAEVIVFIDESDLGDESNYYLDADTAVHMRQQFGSATLEEPDPADPLRTRLRTWWRLHSLVAFKGARAAIRALDDPCARKPQAIDDIRCQEGWHGMNFVLDKYGQRGFALATAHMSALATFLQQRHIPLTVVIYPWYIQLQENDLAPGYTGRWKRWADSAHVAFVNLFPPFFDAARERGVKSMTDDIRFGGDIHWTAKGHAFVAAAFASAYCALPRENTPPAPPLATAICAGGTPGSLTVHPATR